MVKTKNAMHVLKAMTNGKCLRHGLKLNICDYFVTFNEGHPAQIKPRKGVPSLSLDLFRRDLN
jgi:hypothetical protein